MSRFAAYLGAKRVELFSLDKIMKRSTDRHGEMANNIARRSLSETQLTFFAFQIETQKKREEKKKELSVIDCRAIDGKHRVLFRSRQKDRQPVVNDKIYLLYNLIILHYYSPFIIIIIIITLKYQEDTQEPFFCT